MARPRGTPVFTVEVKRTKRNATASTQHGRSDERLANTWASAFDTPPAVNVAPQATTVFRAVEHPDQEAVERSARRILPSLVMPEAEPRPSQAEAEPRPTRMKRRETTGRKKRPAIEMAAAGPESRAPAPAPRADAVPPAPIAAAASGRPSEQAGKGARRQRQRRLMRLSALR